MPPDDKLHAGLRSLGSAGTTYQYAEPTVEILETFPNPSEGSHEVRLTCPEFTSLCPKTGQPDFARIFIRYTPKHRCVETKSLKLYLFAFRQQGQFMEAITNKIRDDLVAVLDPKYLEVVGEFNARGGIDLSCIATHGRLMIPEVEHTLRRVEEIQKSILDQHKSDLGK